MLRLLIYYFVHLRFCPPTSTSVARSKLNAFSVCGSVLRSKIARSWEYGWVCESFILLDAGYIRLNSPQRCAYNWAVSKVLWEWIQNVVSKAIEGTKGVILRLYCWIFSMRVSEEERSVRDGMFFATFSKWNLKSPMRSVLARRLSQCSRM